MHRAMEGGGSRSGSRDLPHRGILHKRGPLFWQERLGRARSGSRGRSPWFSVWLLIQEAGEHGQGSLGLVGGDHVSGALKGKAL